MVLKMRRDDELSDVDGGWFRARWHYSFDTYVDPEYRPTMYGFGGFKKGMKPTDYK